MEKNEVKRRLIDLLKYKNMDLLKIEGYSGATQVELPSLTYADMKNSDLYLVHLVDGSNYNQFLNQKEMYYQVYNKINKIANHIYVLYIFIMDNKSQIEFIDWENFKTDGYIFEKSWMIDCSTNQMFTLPNQLNTFLNLENEIPKILSYQDMPRYHKENTKKNTYLTYALIIINLLVWIVQEWQGGSESTQVLINMGAMNPQLVLNGEWYRLFTAMFLHIGFSHLVMNSFGIYIFGSGLERKITKLEIIIVYLIGGILANVVSLGYHLATGDFLVVAAGASGAVYALTGAILVVSYLTKKKVGGLDTYSILIYFIIGLISSVLNNNNIDISAHIGGFFAGAIVMLLLMLRHRQKG